MLKDQDQDGFIDAVGEAQLFLHPTDPGSLVVAPMVLFAAPGGGILLGCPAQDTLLHAIDLDQDGTASAPGEQQIVFQDQGVLLPSIAGITTMVGPPSIVIESLVPSLVDRSGGTAVQIHGDGWPTGTQVSLRISGIEIPAAAPLSGLITAVFPALPEGAHDMTIIIHQQELFVPTAFHSTAYFQRGDSDRNGTPGIGDAITLLMWMFIPGSSPPPCLDAADFNDDGQLQLPDAVQLLNWLFASGPPPAAPYPDAGPDPDQSGPGCEE
jgi:hypothetical protein